MKIRVLIGPSTFGSADQGPIKKLSEAGFEIIKNSFGRKFTKKELIDNLPGVSGLIAGLENLDSEVLKSSGLKVISRCGSGVENIDFKTARDLGIKVYSTPDAPTVAVAELTVGAMLTLLRHVTQLDRDMHKGKWAKEQGLQLSGKTVVIIGFGRIGSRVARLLRAFDVNIIAVDPHIDRNTANTEHVEYAALTDALPRADIITIHASGNSEILGDKEFKILKKGAFLLNSSRGAAVSESALVSALVESRIAGAWCDSFIEEPYTGALTKFENVLLTPHIGSFTKECRSMMEMEAVDNLIKGFNT